MKISPKSFLTFVLLTMSIVSAAASANAQERIGVPIDRVPITRGDCPNPVQLTLTASSPLSFVASEFNAVQNAGLQMTGLNDLSVNKWYLQTFHWKKGARCCQITRGVLTVKVKSNQGGQSATSADAGNDGIAIMHSGSVVVSQAVYAGLPPFNAGQLATVTIPLTPAMLSNINSSGLFSFSIQDDTGVQSATLQLWGCCLSAQRSDAAELDIKNSSNRE